MDAAGIGIQVISPHPPFLFAWAEAGWAAEVAGLMNEGIAEMVGESPRFWGIGQLPMQSPRLALAELEHVRALGLLGVLVGANIEQVELDDESLEPVWARLSELGLTVFVHPVNPTLLPRMEPYHLTNLIGNPLDTTIALSRLILSGVLVRHPGIRFYFAHAGGFIPYLYGRIDHAYRARDDTSSVIDVLPSTLLQTVWFDTITHAQPPLRYLIDSMSDHNVVVGTDYPADMADTTIAHTLTNLNLTPTSRTRIEHQNAQRLFNQPVS
jgi:aminocarboxymuconate-semialdehyde decarboxylase